jgi:hypothetical protein
MLVESATPSPEKQADSPFRQALSKNKQKYEEANHIIPEQEEPPSSIFFDQSVGTQRSQAISQ